MAEQNIVMKQLNNVGEYDTLYPATVGQQVSGLTFNMVEGNLDASRVTGVPQIEVGTYVGSGTFGSSNPSSLSFSFVPSIVIIYAYRPNAISASYPYSYLGFFTSETGRIYGPNISDSILITRQLINNWSTTITWYHNLGNDAWEQMQDSSTTYGYIAIG